MATYARMDPTPVGSRQAARVILLDPEDRLLLLHATEEHHMWWGMPGGGGKPDETYDEAAARELNEETGLDVPIGPYVLTRDHVFG